MNNFGMGLVSCIKRYSFFLDGVENNLKLQLEDWNNAEMSFRNALRLDPNPTLKGEILYNLGMVLKSKKDYPEAVKVISI